MKKLYKFLRTDLKSDKGDCTWKIGDWKHEDKISICNSGFHASKTPLQALGYVGGEILSIVEVKGKSDIQDNKEVWSDMRIVKAYHWTKNDSVELAIYAAELVIDIYEKKYPNDDRPRKAIEAAKNYLEAVKKGADADAAADAARADAAADAAHADAARADDADAAAARAAAHAADAAAAAARAAARAAAHAAAHAAADARKQLVEKIDKWFIKKIKTLKKYE